ncbi:hypothetical protein [Halovulum sp. GXIMD14793]
MSRLLGALGFVPSVWILVVYISHKLGLTTKGGHIDLGDVFMFFGLAVLSILFLLPTLEQPLVRRSRSSFTRILKYGVVFAASGMLVIVGTAGLLIVDAVSGPWRNLLMAGGLIFWLCYLLLTIYPGWYASELDLRAGNEQRGIGRTANHIKARLTFEASTHGPPRQIPVYAHTPDPARQAFMVLLLMALFGFAVSLYGARFTRFVPDYDFVAILESRALIVAAVMAGLSGLLVLFARRPPGSLLTENRVMLAGVWALVLGASTASMMGTPLATGLGALVPSDRSRAAISAVSVHVAQENGRFGCADELDIVPEGWPSNRQVKLCAVPGGANAGGVDKVISLSGSRNPYGLTVESVEPKQ